MTIANMETYISEPVLGKANGHVLLYFPDVWGMAINGLLIMDGFADAGFLVLGPDYFRGVGPDHSLFSLMPSVLTRSGPCHEAQKESS